MELEFKAKLTSNVPYHLSRILMHNILSVFPGSKHAYIHFTVQETEVQQSRVNYFRPITYEFVVDFGYESKWILFQKPWPLHYPTSKHLAYTRCPTLISKCVLPFSKLSFHSFESVFWSMTLFFFEEEEVQFVYLLSIVYLVSYLKYCWLVQGHHELRFFSFRCNVQVYDFTWAKFFLCGVR